MNVFFVNTSMAVLSLTELASIALAETHEQFNFYDRLNKINGSTFKKTKKDIKKTLYHHVVVDLVDLCFINSVLFYIFTRQHKLIHAIIKNIEFCLYAKLKRHIKCDNFLDSTILLCDVFGRKMCLNYFLLVIADNNSDCYSQSRAIRKILAVQNKKVPLLFHTKSISHNITENYLWDCSFRNKLRKFAQILCKVAVWGGLGLLYGVISTIYESNVAYFNFYSVIHMLVFYIVINFWFVITGFIATYHFNHFIAKIHHPHKIKHTCLCSKFYILSYILSRLVIFFLYMWR